MMVDVVRATRKTNQIKPHCAAERERMGEKTRAKLVVSE